MTSEKTKAGGLNTELKSADEERKTAIKAELVSINENVLKFVLTTSVNKNYYFINSFIGNKFEYIDGNSL